MAYPQKPENTPYPPPPGYSPHPQTYGNPAYSQPPINPAYPQSTGYTQPGYPTYPQSSGYPAYPQPVYTPLNGINQNNIPGNVQAPNVVVIQPSQVQPLYLANKTYLNFTGAIVLSCVAFWLCGGLFGLIAFILAMVGQSSAASGDQASAKPLLISSYVLSGIGILTGIIAIIVLAVLLPRAFAASRMCSGYGCSYYNWYY